MSLRGKPLFVTGASRGIGLAIALRAARDGANIAVVAKTAEPTAKLPGTVFTAAKEIAKAFVRGRVNDRIGLITFGGSATAAQGLVAATGKMLPPSDAGANRAFAVDSTLQTADVEIGWSWHLPDRILLQAALGGVFTFAASSSVAPDYAPKDPVAPRAFTDAAATYLDTTYTKYVFSPTVIVTVGYRL